MTRAWSRAQRGLGLLGVFFVLAIAGALAYFVYQSLTVEPEASSCAAKLEACIKQCRKASTDNDAAQACQDGCKKAAAECDRLRR